MAHSNLGSNPFAALFGSVEQAEQFSNTFKATLKSPEIELASDKPSPSRTNVVQNVSQQNSFIEKVFLITFDQEEYADRPDCCVYLEDLKKSFDGQEWLDLECLDQAVFDRLMLTDPSDHIVCTSSRSPNRQASTEAGVNNPLQYLYQCYVRLETLVKNYNKAEVEKEHEQCKSAIFLNARNCFQHPEIFGDLNPTQEFLNLFSAGFNSSDVDQVTNFLDMVVAEIEANLEDGSLSDFSCPILDILKKKIQSELSLGQGLLYEYLDLVQFFGRNAGLAQVLVDYNAPRDSNNGRSYEDTLFGAILSVSCIVKNEMGPYDFFDQPSRYTKKDHDITEHSIHQPVGILNDRLHQIFITILKSGSGPKHSLLEWLGNCLNANKGRVKLWSRQNPMMFSQMYSSDGFFVNLCAVVLRLCKPFSEPQSTKLLKVQPTYCLATAGVREQCHNRNVHLRELGETGLIPLQEGRENEQPQPEANYNFLSECFFLGHYCLHLGLHCALEHFMKLNQDLHRIQGVYQDIVTQGAQNSEPGLRMKENMEKGMTIFLCLKAALTEPQLLESCFDFHVATTTYLVQMATSYDHSAFQPVQFPLSDNVPTVLTCIPEFVAENVLDFMLFIRRFKDSVYESVDSSKLEHLLTFILVFMGSPERMKNPHLRARMAEALEAIMPPSGDSGRTLLVSHFQREQLFHTHPLSKHLAPILLHVFVSIEMTGQGVEFEQKFNYRRPMYAILEYLWGVQKHADSIKELARHAEEHIAAVTAPLFLRFINLLINDAIFLLDEALSYMVQIKEKEQEKDRGDWNNLNPRQRQETEMNFRHLTMLARFHNMMGNDTIKTLEMITKDIKSIFYDDVLVDRIAAMLNYFLVHLVGPKMKNLKVNDFEKFEFRPDRTVSHISEIYLNLGEGEAFNRAVASDGRSYSAELFQRAQAVLVKIHRPMDRILMFEELAKEFQVLAKQQEEEDEVLNDAPDDFLDPIMGTFMRDPVDLPSSGKTVDRRTIARHILSDQFDPFNRQPLTMDMVKPNTALKEQIEHWLDEWRNKKSKDS